MDFSNLLDQKGILLVPVLWVLGALLKNTPKMPNWLIPWCLMVAGILLMIPQVGLSWQTLSQGILAAGVAVGLHQAVKQSIDKKN